MNTGDVIVWLKIIMLLLNMFPGFWRFTSTCCIRPLI